MQVRMSNPAYWVRASLTTLRWECGRNPSKMPGPDMQARSAKLFRDHDVAMALIQLSDQNVLVIA